MKFTYSKPELVDYTFVAAQGITPSCFVDCTSDELCTSDDEI